jgi:thioredoxin 1
MSANITEVSDSQFTDLVLSSDKPVVVDFWAPWCMPCRMQGPILERFATKHPGVSVVKINVDEAPKVAGSFGIRSIPTIGLFHDGELVARAVGVQDEGALGRLVQKAS